MKKMSLVLLPIVLLLGLALGAQALQIEALPDATPTAVSDCADVEIAPDTSAEWPLRPSFLQASVLETGFSSCVECSAHSQCVSVCGVPWAACIPMTGCGSGRHCSCN
ncbi:MAG: hypothetical protein AAGF23_09745 [Acidobacteriota bacterium]